MKPMMINKEEFQYLLERVQEVNNQSVEREIEIQCKHVYEEWVADKANPNGGHWETRTEYPYRSVTVNSDDIEKYKLDWQLVYSLCDQYHVRCQWMDARKCDRGIQGRPGALRRQIMR